MSSKLEQLEFKLEKNIGIWKHAGKVRKSIEIWKSLFSYEILVYIKVKILWAENDLKKFTNNLSGFL